MKKLLILLAACSSISAGAQVLTCSTSGGIVFHDGIKLVCSSGVTTGKDGSGLSVTSGVFTSRTQNGWLNATQFLARGNDGIANAARTGQNQTILAEPNYPGKEQYFLPVRTRRQIPAVNALPNGTHLHDLRNGTQWDLYRNPTASPLQENLTYAQFRSCQWDSPPAALSAPNSAQTICDAEDNFVTGAGLSLGSPWYINAAHLWSNTFLTRGISQTLSMNTVKAGAGDSASIYAYHYCLGGLSAGSDEGCEPVDIQGGVLWAPLQGTSTVSGSGLTSLAVKCVQNCSYAGDGRFLTVTSQASEPFYIDRAPRIAGTQTEEIVSSGSKFPVSNAFGTVTKASGHTNGSVGTNLQIGVIEVSSLSGTFKAGLPVCLAGGYYEVAEVKAVEVGAKSQTLTVNLRNPIHPGMEAWQGGMCGKGIVFLYGEDWATVRNGHQWVVWPVAGSPDSHTLRIFANAKGGQNGPQSIYVKGDATFAMRSIIRSGNRVTASLVNENSGGADRLIQPPGKLTSITVSHGSEPSINGNLAGVAIASDDPLGLAGPGKFVWEQTGADILDGQTATVEVKGIDYAVVLPIMEVVAASLPDASGTVPLQVEYNTNTVSTADTLEEPVHPWFGGAGQVINWTGGHGPFNMGSSPALILNTRGSIGSSILVRNYNPKSYYTSLGGHATPETAVVFTGIYGSILAINQPPLKLGSTAGSVISVGCPVLGCKAAGGAYNLEFLAGDRSQFLTTWNPATNSYTLAAGGNRWLYTPAMTNLSKPLQLSAVKNDPAELSPGMLWNRGDLGRPRWYNTAAHSLAFQEELPLPGTTASIGGRPIAGGSCVTGTAEVAGAMTGTPVAVSASDGSLPNALIILSAAVTASNTVTVQLCAVATVTPAAKTYRVSVVR